MKAKLIVAFVFLCAAASIGGGFYFAHFRPRDVDEVAAAGSAVVFLVAAIAASVKIRRGCWLGLAGAVLALPWFIRRELGMTPWSSWLYLNCEAGRSFESSCGHLFIRWGVIGMRFYYNFGCLLGIVPASSAMEPATLACVRNELFGAGDLVRPFGESYQLPVFHDGVPARLRILHVEKSGFRFHDTGVFEFRDGRVWATHADRRWFQYRFEAKGGAGAVSPVLYERANAFIEAAKVWNLHTPPPRALWTWNAEGWYVVTPDRRFSFAGAQAPEEVRLLFRDLESSSRPEGIGTVRDVCLGFCYDPPAALGFRSLGARCWLIRAE